MILRLPGLGMTREEARQILASGQATDEQLQEAWRVYYGQSIAQEPEHGPGSVMTAEEISAQSNLRPEQVQWLINQGYTPNQILMTYGYAYAGKSEQERELVERSGQLESQAERLKLYTMEQCDPLDGDCIRRNAARQQANFAIQAEYNRLTNLAVCYENASRNPSPLREQILARCRQYETPVQIPSAPDAGRITIERYLELAEQQAGAAQAMAQQQAAGYTGQPMTVTYSTGQTFRQQQQQQQQQQKPDHRPPIDDDARQQKQEIPQWVWFAGAALLAVLLLRGK